MSPAEFFDSHFKRLREAAPYPWQAKLFAQIISGDWPQVVDMPTGVGKTAVLWIWWLALAWSKKQRTNGIPIRLAWVVNRRVVVDQVTEEVKQLCEKWRNVGFGTLPDPPAASTLRGALADNGEWRSDPTKPAVIVGTVDMIGSRLLFRGYRSGPYWRPIESGLLGVDTLIVNDEAHLSPAFSKLVRELEEMKPAGRTPGKSFRYMLLSATQDSAEDLVRFKHDPAEDASASARFQQTWQAQKSLELREAANGTALKAELWKLATGTPAPRTIVFIESPEEALAFYKRLHADKFKAALMTGTMRGKERDELVEKNEVFRRFTVTDPGAGPVFLVATSAAEVGVNLTCERMVTELREADHLIQRFGRLNRFGADGNGKPIRGEAYVVYVEPKKDSQARLKATLEYLRDLDRNVSPQNLWETRPPDDAVSEKPKTARLEAWRVDSWAQTSYHDSDLKRIEPWLRGKEDDPPQTEVAWRADLEYLQRWGLSERQIKQALDAFPVLAKERLQEPSGRVLDKLKEISGKLDGKSDWISIVQPDQSVRWAQISKLQRREDIQYCLVILPDHIGRLEEHGMFDPEVGQNEEKSKDAATSDDRVGLLYREGAWTYLGKSLEVTPPSDNSRKAIAAFAEDNGFRAPFILRSPEDESHETLVYLRKRGNSGERKLQEIPLDKHQQEVADCARNLAEGAGLHDLAGLYFNAGRAHDEGKRHPRWQTAMGAENPPAAKTVAAKNSSLLDGYRHEFGSLLQAAGRDGADDLLLHLIATHHAGGRPFFERDAFGPLPETECERVARQAEHRFARLQQKYGPWGLAYLEAIFKRADGLTSAREGDGASG